jgi:hypothetical protein
MSMQTELPAARSPGAFARYHGISRSYVYDKINEGLIIARKLGGRTLIFDSDNADFRQSLPVLKPKAPVQ